MFVENLYLVQGNKTIDWEGKLKNNRYLETDKASYLLI